MSQLTEVKTSKEHYFTDEAGVRQGLYKSYFDEGQLDTECFYVDGEYHGRYTEYTESGPIWGQTFFVDGRNICHEVMLEVSDINSITDGERAILKARHDFELC